MNTPFKKRESPLTLQAESTETPVKEKQVVKHAVTVSKEKYTAVMDRSLRIKVKVASAKKGLQFSQYIEEAVKEKLEREEY